MKIYTVEIENMHGGLRDLTVAADNLKEAVSKANKGEFVEIYNGYFDIQRICLKK